MIKKHVLPFRGAPALPLFVLVALSLQAQAPAFTSLPPLPFDTAGPVLRAPAQPQRPFTVAGPRGVLIGQQDGTLEAWVLPVKVFSHLSIEAAIDGFPEPIPVNDHAAQIEVRPDRTILTYAHPGFVVRQIMFSPPAGPAAPDLATTGPVILFEFDCLHPTEFTFRLSPNLEWMWPQRNAGPVDADWVPSAALPLDGPAARQAPGFYALHNTFPDLGAAIAMPGSRPGIGASDFERPAAYPVELKLHIDPARDHDRLFPLLMAVGMNSATATNTALGAALARLNADLPTLYRAQAQHYTDLLAHATTIQTPDKSLDEAYLWAVLSIDQLRTLTTPAATPREFAAQIPETALVAGYFSSGTSNRPGFGWFFGRDALYTLYAVNGYGGFALTRAELEFLIHRQRADGKIMHEYSQTAAAVDWQQFPYEYAAADSTPLFLLAVADYVRSSGDTAFLAAHRDAVEKAWSFETDPTHDTDHDGIYDNSQGTGWVESWPGGMPHQEIYLALLDQQASAAYAYLQTQLKDSSKAESAERRAAAIAKTINIEYYDSEKSCYGFSHDLAKDGTTTLDRTRTIYPALAWWDPAGAKPILDHPEACLRQFVASSLNTDWGTRDVANDEKLYDGMSYHQGTVWPLFTGWASLAEYRANQPLAGYQLLKENANLTWAQDLGADTELLSGDFYVPMGRSTSHQLWSSAMVITPTLRGLFGISIDAATKTITVNPHLPASWDSAEIRNLPLPGGEETLHFDRQGERLLIDMTDLNNSHWQLRSDLPGAFIGHFAQVRKEIHDLLPRQLAIPLPPLEFDPMLTGFASNVLDKTILLDEPPTSGARTSRYRVVHSEYGDRKLTLTLEGLAGTQAVASLLRHGVLIPKVQPDPSTGKPSAVISAEDGWAFKDPNAPLLLIMDFPAGQGFQNLTVTLTW